MIVHAFTTPYYLMTAIDSLTILFTFGAILAALYGIVRLYREAKVFYKIFYQDRGEGDL